MHYMKREEHGMRVWHVANLGEGRLITWDTIKSHFHGKNVVDPCVPLIDVPAAIDPARAATAGASIPSNEFVPKIHRSHRNVKNMKVERALRQESKRLTREKNFQDKVKDLKTNVKEVQRFRCQCCFEYMISAKSLQRHQLNGCTLARGRRRRLKALIESDTNNASSDADSQQPETNSEAVDTSTVACRLTLTRGYAWMALRAHVTETVGPRAKLILEQSFQRGVAKGGDRQSCFQMVSAHYSHRSNRNTGPIHIARTVILTLTFHRVSRKNFWRLVYPSRSA